MLHVKSRFGSAVMPASATKLWYLSQFNLFSEMTPAEMEEIAHLAVHKEIPKAQAIYLPGDPANTIYLLKKGKVRISQLSEEGREATLAMLGPGDIFGELAFLDNLESRNEVAEAIEDSFLCLVNKQDFEHLMVKKPQLNLRITKLMGLRLQRIENRVFNLIFKDAYSRLEELLHQLASDYGVPHREGILINIKLTHQDMGNLINTTRQTVSEGISQLKQAGKLKTEGQKIVLLNRKGTP